MTDISKWDVAHMKSAEMYSELSSAVRAKVGAVAVTPQDVMIYSYNGTASGDDNCCEYVETIDGVEQLTTKPTVLHAERNIIAKSSKEGVSLNNAAMYVTMSPCLECSLMLFQSGVSKVFYRDIYRDTSGIDYLKSHGVVVKQLNPKTIDNS